MSDLQRITYAIKHAQGKAVVAFSFEDWQSLIRTDGNVTVLNQIPGPLNNDQLKACTIATVASGIANPIPGIDVLRYDEQDNPYVVNIDHYSVVENLSFTPLYHQALKIANIEDSAELRAEIDTHVFVIKEDPDPNNHWVQDIPKYVLDAQKKEQGDP